MKMMITMTISISLFENDDYEFNDQFYVMEMMTMMKMNGMNMMIMKKLINLSFENYSSHYHNVSDDDDDDKSLPF